MEKMIKNFTHAKAFLDMFKLKLEISHYNFKKISIVNKNSFPVGQFIINDDNSFTISFIIGKCEIKAVLTDTDGLFPASEKFSTTINYTVIPKKNTMFDLINASMVFLMSNEIRHEIYIKKNDKSIIWLKTNNDIHYYSIFDFEQNEKVVFGKETCISHFDLSHSYRFQRQIDEDRKCIEKSTVVIYRKKYNVCHFDDNLILTIQEAPVVSQGLTIMKSDVKESYQLILRENVVCQIHHEMMNANFQMMEFISKIRNMLMLNDISLFDEVFLSVFTTKEEYKKVFDIANEENIKEGLKPYCYNKKRI